MQLLLTAAISGVAAKVIWDIVFVVVAIDPVHYAVFRSEISPLIPVSVLGMLVAPLVAMLHFAPKRSYTEKLIVFNRITWPILILLPALLCFRYNYWIILLTLLVGSILVFRIALITRWNNCSPRKLMMSKTGILLILLLFVAGTAWGFHMQQQAFNSLFLLFADWGVYASGYLNLASGNGIQLIDFFVNAGHWNPLANLTMSAAIWIFPHEKTIFLINSLLIASAAPLAYWLSRSFRLPTIVALLIGMLALINPVFSNQHLALFYGFHPIYFFIPVLFGFFIFKQINCRAGMVAMFIVSLFVQETVLVYWAGYAIYLALCHRLYARGSVLFVFSVATFLLLSSVVIPMAYEDNHYS